MRILDKIGLIIFSSIVLIIAVICCLLVFGWITPTTVADYITIALNNTIASNVILTISSLCILLAIKCIFFRT